MELSFKTVPRGNSVAVAPKNVDPAFQNGYMEALRYFRDEAGAQDLDVTFPSVDDRDQFVKYARACAVQDNMKFRAIYGEKGVARLVFRMETLASFEARKAEREKAAADREARRAAGEVIKPGRRASK